MNTQTTEDGRLDPERDDYDVFLDTWEPSERLQHTTLEQNIFDPLAQARLFADMEGTAPVERAPFLPGPKRMTDREEQLRKYDYFKRNQENWSEEFRTRLIDAGLDEGKVDRFILRFATDWIDGTNRRQNTPDMLAIKASIRDHDWFFHREYAGRYVLKPVPEDVEPFFNALEMCSRSSRSILICWRSASKTTSPSSTASTAARSIIVICVEGECPNFCV